ncbi:MAG TPA: DUF4118 domain-containing protein [Bacteroidales bacterium]|nr:DUF4118 domain-containing protein [Bacteroidales bacterium]
MIIRKNKLWFKILSGFRLWEYLLALFTIALVVCICVPISKISGYHIVSYLLLLVVVLLSAFLKTGPIMLASILSAVVWNFFFIPPFLTFKINETEDLLIYSLFFIIVIINGIFTTRLRHQKQKAIEGEEFTNALFILSRELSKARNISEAISIATIQIKDNFNVKAEFILQDGNNNLINTFLLDNTLRLHEFDICQYVFENQINAGKKTKLFSDCDKTFYPLKGNVIKPGVLVVEQNNSYNKKQQSFWDIYISLVTSALEREFLKEKALEAKILSESDKLYKVLFNSISHELRIPVATILSATDSLISTKNNKEITRELYLEISSATIRLNRLIENLLNMSRLETGRIAVRLDWYDIRDVLNKVHSELKEELISFNIRIIVQKDIPLVKIDFGLIEQAVYNVVYNSVQHSSKGTDIVINAAVKDKNLEIDIEDNGIGFSEKSLNYIFNKFYRSDIKRTGGLGLGLSIVKGFVEAHNGIVVASNRRNGGAKIKMKIPTDNPDFINIEIENE